MYYHLLESLLDKSKMAYKFLPKQGDIDRLIAKINKKVLRDTNLCVDLRDLKAAYLTSPHFRDIYLYLLQNRMPLGKGAAKRLDQNASNYLILDGLLFKILDDGEGNLDTVLCIPTSKVHICHASARPPDFPSTTPHIPSSLDGTRNCKALNRSRSSECSNRTPPSKSNTALFLRGKASANQRLSCH